MIAGKKYNGSGVDIWSCGVILFAIICGFLPFEDPKTSNLYKKILAGEFNVPPFVSPEGKDLLKQILITDPEKRIKIPDIRNHAWMKTYEHVYNKGHLVGIDRVKVSCYS
jgi:5'-AMP-activated protein kinase catalytic alpha subunit